MEKRKNDAVRDALPPIIVAFLAIIVFFAAVSLFLSMPGKMPESEEGAIEILINGKKPFIENEKAGIKAYSACGEFALSLDGSRLAESEKGIAKAELVLSSGAHEIIAQGENCQGKALIEVLARECSEGEIKPCNDGPCTGKMECIDGLFGSCMLGKKVCPPGERTGCSLDACSFGYRLCNSCGTGFGPCMPAGNAS